MEGMNESLVSVWSLCVGVSRKFFLKVKWSKMIPVFGLMDASFLKKKKKISMKFDFLQTIALTRGGHRRGTSYG